MKASVFVCATASSFYFVSKWSRTRGSLAGRRDCGICTGWSDWSVDDWPAPVDHRWWELMRVELQRTKGFQKIWPHWNVTFLKLKATNKKDLGLSGKYICLRKQWKSLLCGFYNKEGRSGTKTCDTGARLVTKKSLRCSEALQPRREMTAENKRVHMDERRGGSVMSACSARRGPT